MISITGGRSLIGMLSSQRIKTGLQSAGFPDDLIPIMTAIAFAESGGNPRAHNNNISTGDNSYGLLQINMIDDIGRERRENFSLKSNRDLFDPSTNFKVAKQIYDQQGLAAWGSYRNGSYKPFLEEPKDCLLPDKERGNAFNISENYSFGVRDLLLKPAANRDLILRFDQDNVSSIFFNDEDEDDDPLIKPVSFKKLSKQIRLALTNQQPVNISIQYWEEEFKMNFLRVVDFSHRKSGLLIHADSLYSDQPDGLLESQKISDIGFIVNIG